MIDTSLFVASGTSPQTIFHEVEVAAPPNEVFAAWTTESGWRAWFDARVRVELRVGGPYEILFDDDEPEGLKGSEGCQILAWVPDQALLFTWNAPPMFPVERAQRTWVLVLFDAMQGGTRIRLWNAGHGQDGHWPDVQAYFQRAWGRVLQMNQEQFGSI